MRDRKPTVLKVLIALAVALFFEFAGAATFHDAKPGDTVKRLEAYESATLEAPIYKCRQARIGTNLGPVYVPNTKASWHRKVGAGLTGEALKARLKAKQPTWKCHAIYIDPDTGKPRNVPADDAEELED